MSVLREPLECRDRHGFSRCLPQNGQDPSVSLLPQPRVASSPGNIIGEAPGSKNADVRRPLRLRLNFIQLSSLSIGAAGLCVSGLLHQRRFCCKSMHATYSQLSVNCPKVDADPPRRIHCAPRRLRGSRRLQTSVGREYVATPQVTSRLAVAIPTHTPDRQTDCIAAREQVGSSYLLRLYLEADDVDTPIPVVA